MKYSMKKTNKIIILLTLFLFILFISFYFKKEGATFTAYERKGPRYYTRPWDRNPVYDYDSYTSYYGTAEQKVTNCQNKCSERPDCKGIIVSDKCYMSKSIDKQTRLVDDLVFKGYYVNTYIKN